MNLYQYDDVRELKALIGYVFKATAIGCICGFLSIHYLTCVSRVRNDH